MRKIAQKCVAIGLVVALSACSFSDEGNKKNIAGSTWYDYGNGLVNLSQVKNIRSISNIQLIVTSKDALNSGDKFSQDYGNSSIEQRALIDAHLNFCFDKIHASDEKIRGDYRTEWVSFGKPASIGSYVGGASKGELKAGISSIRNLIDVEFAKACAIKVAGTASIEFDGFTVTLPNLQATFRYDVDEKSPPSDEAVRSAFDTAVGDLKDGVTPWNKEYANVMR